MKITKKKLQELDACVPGVDWFESQFPEGATIEELLDRIRYKKAPWMSWLFANFKLSGVCEGWYPNGQLCDRDSYVNGKLNGLCEWCYSNGQFASRENYVNDELDRVCEYWDKNGKLRSRENYVNGVKV
jgi:hypothetical protein